MQGPSLAALSANAKGSWVSSTSFTGAAREVVRSWEPSPWPGDGRPWGALGSCRSGWVWGGNPAHLRYLLSDWLHSSNIRRNP